jgi:hypothetical protein
MCGGEKTFGGGAKYLWGWVGAKQRAWSGVKQTLPHLSTII